MTAPSPSVRVDKRTPWVPWLIALVVAAIIAVVAWLLLADDEEAEPVTGEAAIEEPVGDDVVDEPVVEEPISPADEEPEVIEPPVEPIQLVQPFGDLPFEQGAAVTASDVPVVDVPADEAFTIGTEGDELLVYISEAARNGESMTNVEPGSVVTSLEGTFEPITEELLTQLNLEGDEADAIRELGFYVAATSFEIAQGSTG